jgi:hypothetical protein
MQWTSPEAQLGTSREAQPAAEAWPCAYRCACPYAAAQGILLAVMLSSVFWIGLAVTLWTV